MGTEIGIRCRRCGQQLNDDDGFDRDAQLCIRCSSVTRYYCRHSINIHSFDTSILIEEIKQRVENEYTITKYASELHDLVRAISRLPVH